jgi:energy-converting hydrogenase Eha subunit C
LHASRSGSKRRANNGGPGRILEIAPILIIIGILLVIGGFALIAYVTIERVANPMSIFDIIGFVMFAVGIISIWGAWRRLS